MINVNIKKGITNIIKSQETGVPIGTSGLVIRGPQGEPGPPGPKGDSVEYDDTALRTLISDKADKVHYHSEYLTEHQSLQGYLKTESDPTVPSWAKTPQKPSYDYDEIKNKPTLFDGNYNSLTNKPTIPTVPTTLPNPYKLTINGTEYDGSKNVEVTVQGGGSDDHINQLIQSAIISDKKVVMDTENFTGCSLSEAMDSTLDYIETVEGMVSGKADANHTHSQYLTEHQSLNGYIGAKAVGSVTDFNNLSSVGVYYITTANANSMANAPVKNYGVLTVCYGTDVPGNIMQTYVSGDGKTFNRIKTSGGWSSWSNLVLTTDGRLSDARTPKSHTHTKSQITDFPTFKTINGNTITGTGNITISGGGDPVRAIPEATIREICSIKVVGGYNLYFNSGESSDVIIRYADGTETTYTDYDIADSTIEEVNNVEAFKLIESDMQIEFGVAGEDYPTFILVSPYSGEESLTGPRSSIYLSNPQWIKLTEDMIIENFYPD